MESDKSPVPTPSKLLTPAVRRTPEKPAASVIPCEDSTFLVNRMLKLNINSPVAETVVMPAAEVKSSCPDESEPEVKVEPKKEAGSAENGTPTKSVARTPLSKRFEEEELKSSVKKTPARLRVSSSFEGKTPAKPLDEKALANQRTEDKESTPAVTKTPIKLHASSLVRRSTPVKVLDAKPLTRAASKSDVRVSTRGTLAKAVNMRDVSASLKDNKLISRRTLTGPAAASRPRISLSDGRTPSKLLSLKTSKSEPKVEASSSQELASICASFAKKTSTRFASVSSSQGRRTRAVVPLVSCESCSGSSSSDDDLPKLVEKKTPTVPVARRQANSSGGGKTPTRPVKKVSCTTSWSSSEGDSFFSPIGRNQRYPLRHAKAPQEGSINSFTSTLSSPDQMVDDDLGYYSPNLRSSRRIARPAIVNAEHSASSCSSAPEEQSDGCLIVPGPKYSSSFSSSEDDDQVKLQLGLGRAARGAEDSPRDSDEKRGAAAKPFKDTPLKSFVKYESSASEKGTSPQEMQANLPNTPVLMAAGKPKVTVAPIPRLSQLIKESRLSGQKAEGAGNVPKQANEVKPVKEGHALVPSSPVRAASIGEAAAAATTPKPVQPILKEAPTPKADRRKVSFKLEQAEATKLTETAPVQSQRDECTVKSAQLLSEEAAVLKLNLSQSTEAAAAAATAPAPSPRSTPKSALTRPRRVSFKPDQAQSADVNDKEREQCTAKSSQLIFEEAALLKSVLSRPEEAPTSVLTPADAAVPKQGESPSSATSIIKLIRSAAAEKPLTDANAARLALMRSSRAATFNQMAAEFESAISQSGAAEHDRGYFSIDEKIAARASRRCRMREPEAPSTATFDMAQFLQGMEQMLPQLRMSTAPKPPTDPAELMQRRVAFFDLKQGTCSRLGFATRLKFEAYMCRFDSVQEFSEFSVVMVYIRGLKSRVLKALLIKDCVTTMCRAEEVTRHFARAVETMKVLSGGKFRPAHIPMSYWTLPDKQQTEKDMNESEL